MHYFLGNKKSEQTAPLPLRFDEYFRIKMPPFLLQSNIYIFLRVCNFACLLGSNPLFIGFRERGRFEVSAGS